MPWLRVSDTAGMNPMVLAPLTDTANDGLDPYDRANVLFGMVSRCSTMSAGYVTDYLVTDAVVMQVAGPHWQARAEAAERAGYWTRCDKGWLIVNDPDHFVHIRMRAELEWEAQQKADNANPLFTVPARIRDGDACRYCTNIVNWGARKGARRGTYDHRVPGQAAQTPEDLRVCCGSCNSSRGNRPDADDRLPALPPPPRPYYGEKTRTFLADHGYVVPADGGTPTRPGSQPATATPRPRTQRDNATTPRPGIRPAPATSGPDTQPDPAKPTTQRPQIAAASSTATPPPAGPRDGQRPGSRPENAPNASSTAPAERGPPPPREHRSSADPADRRSAGSGLPGRDGSGRERYPPQGGAVRRGRRGRRRRRPTSDPPRPSAT